MSKEQIIKAWKDEAYRKRLSKEQRAQLPQHPAGLIELSDADLEWASGGDKRISKACSNSFLE